jgi:hypothetical protein
VQTLVIGISTLLRFSAMSVNVLSPLEGSTKVDLILILFSSSFGAEKEKLLASVAADMLTGKSLPEFLTLTRSFIVELSWNLVPSVFDANVHPIKTSVLLVLSLELQVSPNPPATSDGCSVFF